MGGVKKPVRPHVPAKSLETSKRTATVLYLKNCKIIIDSLDPSIRDPMKYLEARMCPIPSAKVEEKFQYFYRPYNYAVNTEKYMTFEGSDVAKQRSIEAEQIE